MHETVLESKHFINWALTCAYIVQTAYTISEANLCTLIDDSETSEDILRKILPGFVFNNIVDRLKERRDARIKAGSFVSTQEELSSPEYVRKCAPAIKRQRQQKQNSKQGELNLCAV
jgi:glycerol-3-phosphate responsive antiterminator